MTTTTTDTTTAMIAQTDRDFLSLVSLPGLEAIHEGRRLLAINNPAAAFAALDYARADAELARRREIARVRKLLEALEAEQADRVLCAKERRAAKARARGQR